MDASKKHTNRLIDETSPYLLQHAHNPVDWYPWGDEAFERARAENKPVLVSIGYSACHWCHVMEHESFEDETIAKIQNDHFINIKVDMEERPDVDQIYMNFVQLTTGRGGWPMNVFLTADKRPFFGGTYFPPSPRYGMPSWQQILSSISEAFRDRRDELEDSANEIVNELRRLTIAQASPESLSNDLLEHSFQSLARTFDAVNGGFGGAPKFPPAMSLEFLLRYHHRTGDQRALQMVTQTLDNMASGGIYDQLGGGFHRYAVDAIWLVPHFEKMLYDNAQLARVYLHAYQVTGDGLYRRVAVETLEYVRREMLDASGGFYSTQDADSEGEEGKFFVWTPDEIADALGDDAAEFNRTFDVTVAGNFEGKNILNLKHVGAEVRGSEIFPSARARLFAERESRIRPGRDEKVLTAWNGLMMAAFSDAAGALDNAHYLEIAKQNARFIRSELQRDGRLLRTWKNGEPKLNGYLEDYANVADGLLELYRVSGDIEYLAEARRLADQMIGGFWDGDHGGFFFTSNDHEELFVRNKDFYDNATPSGNSVAADVMLRLSKLTADDRYERFAVTVLRLAAGQIQRHPQGFGRALSALEFHLTATKEVAIIGERPNDLERQISQTYLPDAVVALSSDPRSDGTAVPWLEGRRSIRGKPTAFVCENFVCGRAVTTQDELSKLLSANEKARSSRTIRP